MSEPGLQVTIKYNALKFNYSDGRPRDEVSIVMNDLRLLRVHAPSRKNILREGETKFTLLWPLARKDPKIPNNTLYSRWIKLSRHDLEESVQLRKRFMIESITVIEGGRLASSTGKWDPQPQTGASGVPAGDVLVHLQPPFKHVFVPKRPTHNLRKKLKSAATRQACTTRNTSLQSSNTMEPPTSRKRRSDEEDMSRSPRRRKLDDSASISSRRSPEHEAGHSSSECSSGIYPASTDRSESTLRPHSDPPASPRTDCHAGEDRICNGATGIVSSLDEDHIASLTHEAWGIREKMMTLGDRDESIRRELCSLDKVPPLDPVSLSNSEHVQVQALESRLAQMEAELQEERERRIRAERALEDVERECRSPFVVPALFRAFMTISELPI